MYLKTYNTINNLPHSINDLFDQNEKKSLFLSKKWFQLYEQYFLKPQNNYFLVVFNKQHQALILVLLHCLKEDNLLAASNFYTPLFVPLLRNNLPEKILKQAYSLMISHYLLPNHIHSLDLKPLQLTSFEIKMLIKVLKQHHFIVDSSFYCANWTINIPNIDFQQYYKQRPSKLKNTLKRKMNKLNKTETHSINIYTKVEDIKSHLNEYEKIYQLSWKVDEASTEFIHDFILSYAQTGHTRLGIAEINGQAVASQFWLVHNNIALIYKLAYDADYKSYSIGSTLTAKMMQYVIDIDGVKKVDFLTGDDNYKKDWMNRRQELSRIIAYNSHTLEGFSGGMFYLLKTMIKKIPGILHLYRVKKNHV